MGSGRLCKAAAASTLLLGIVALEPVSPVTAAGTVSLADPATPYTQNFDTLASSGTENTTVPTGWEFAESSTNANTTYRAGTGSDTAGDTYSFGAAGSTDRAFGGLRSGALVPVVGASFTNNTGATITSLAVSYTGEQWRLGQNTADRAADRLDFQLSTNATSLATGTWTDYNSLDFASPVVAGTVGALNGNSAPNRTALSSTITGLTLANGATFWIRWADTDLIPGADDGLAIDDFSMSVVDATVLSVNDVTANEGNAGTTDFVFTVSLSAPAGPGGVSFDIATADNTATTADNDYAMQSLVGQTIPAGSSSYAFTVVVNGDTAPEADETFLVNVTNVVGATVVDGQGQGTITNDDGDVAPGVSTVSPAHGASSVAADQNIVVTFTEAVNVSDPWFTLECVSTGTKPAAVTGGPVTFTINPTTDFGFAETCTLTVIASKISDQDANDPPDAMAADYAVSFETEADPCTLTYTPIPQIQGSGASAAITGAVTTQGVVVGDYEGPSPALRGFFIQDPTGDGNVATSDGIFVFESSNANTVSVGDVVRVTGTAGENQGQTQVSVGTIRKCGTGTVAPTDVTLPVSSADYLERFEGMLVRFPQTLTVTEHFQLGRFGQVVMSSDGRLVQPTSIATPGADANALQAANNLRRIIFDDATQAQNPDPILFARDGQPLSATNTLRGGDTATNAIGVLTYTWAGNSASPNAYRLRPINALNGSVNFVPGNPRPTTPPAVGGSIQVGSFNVLNYFPTIDSARTCGPSLNQECRGADNAPGNPTPVSRVELERQQSKLFAAVAGLDADVLGLIELENTTGVDPLSGPDGIVPGVNALTAPGTYVSIDTGVIGTDAIRAGLIYKPAVVTPVGAFELIDSTDDPRFDDSRNRPVLVQTFEENATGARFTVAVHHLKSKGSACGTLDPDARDGQGNCNLTRLAAATAIADYFAARPGDSDVLLLGDMNAYAKEDPIAALTDAGFIDLIGQYGGPSAYGYVFDGQWGYLDHALASPSMAAQVTGAAEWHINADEPSVLDYNIEFKTANHQTSLFASDPYRTSDHDPVLVGLDLDDLAPTVTASGPETATEGTTVTVTATGSDPEGRAVTYAWDVDGDGFDDGTGPSVTFTTPLTAPSTITVRVRASDPTGNTTIASHQIQLLYDFGGFFPPVGPLPAINTVNAGASVPVKFTLGGDQGLGILDAVSASVQPCSATGAPGQTVTASTSRLRYDSVTGQYIYVWRTDRSWTGCRLLTLTFDDGESYQALFSFTR